MGVCVNDESTGYRRGALDRRDPRRPVAQRLRRRDRDRSGGRQLRATPRTPGCARSSTVAHAAPARRSSRDVEPTQAEWEQAIGFLTAIGPEVRRPRARSSSCSRTCSGSRCWSTTINDREPGRTPRSPPCSGPSTWSPPRAASSATTSTRRQHGRARAWSRGRVPRPRRRARSPAPGSTSGRPNEDGFYDVQQPGHPAARQPPRAVHHRRRRAVLVPDAWCPRHYPIPDRRTGRRAAAAHVGRHPYRPAHIHFIAEAEGHRPVTHPPVRRGQSLPRGRHGLRGEAEPGPTGVGRGRGPGHRLRRHARVSLRPVAWPPVVEYLGLSQRRRGGPMHATARRRGGLGIAVASLLLRWPGAGALEPAAGPGDAARGALPHLCATLPAATAGRPGRQLQHRRRRATPTAACSLRSTRRP